MLFLAISIKGHKTFFPDSALRLSGRRFIAGGKTMPPGIAPGVTQLIPIIRGPHKVQKFISPAISLVKVKFCARFTNCMRRYNIKLAIAVPRSV